MAPPSYVFPELAFPALTPPVDVFLQLSSFCLTLNLFIYRSTLGDGRPAEQPPQLRRAVVNDQVNTQGRRRRWLLSFPLMDLGGLNKEMDAWRKAGDPGDSRKASSVRDETEGR